MRLVILVAVLAVIAAAAMPPAGAGADPGRWEPKLVLPGGHISDVVFADQSTVWAVGDGGVFLSEDGGRSWRTVYTTSSHLIAVDAAPDGVRGWAVGTLGEVIATNDGGRSWAAQDARTDINLSKVVALDSDSAIIAGLGQGYSDVVILPQPHTIRRTDDGGSTWRDVVVPGGYSANAMDFLDDARHGWLSGSRCPPDLPEGMSCGAMERALLRTTDGGATWTVVNDDRFVTSLQFVIPDVGWAVGFDCVGGTGLCISKLFRSVDGGATWSPVRALAEPGVNAFVAFDAQSVVLVETACVQGECEHALLETRDSGTTWSTVWGPQEGYGSGLLAFHDRAHGVWRDSWTTDGRTWNPRTEFPVTAGSGAFDFIDGTTGWLAASKLLRTTNGGGAWTVASDRRFDEVEFVSAVEGWAVEYDCTDLCTAVVAHTMDGGLTWEKQTELAGLESASGRLVFADAANGWFVAPYDGRLLHTADGGRSWHSVTLPAVDWYNSPDLAFAGRSNVWFAAQVCAAGLEACVIRVFRSADAGETWQEMASIPETEACGSPQMTAVDDAFAWIVAAECVTVVRPVVFRTTDGGLTWTAHPLGSVGQIGPVVFFNRWVGRALRAVCPQTDPSSPCRDVLLRTSDGGRTWTEEPTGLKEPWNLTYHFVSPERAWRLIQNGGGMFSVTRQTLYSYTGGLEPDAGPIYGPDVGTGASGGRTSHVPALTLLALAAVTLSFARLRLARGG